MSSQQRFVHSRRPSHLVRIVHLVALITLLGVPAGPLRAAPQADTTAVVRSMTRMEFSGTALPVGWAATKVGTSKAWTVGTTGTITAGSGVVGAHARADNSASLAKAMNTTLTLPVIDLTGVVSPVLSYNSDFLNVTGSMGNVDLSLNGGVSWTTVTTLTATTQGVQQLALPTAAGNANARLRLRYKATANTTATTAAVRNKKRWRVDNIEVRDLPVPSAPGDLSTDVQGTTLTLSWTDSSSSEAGFRVERSADGGTSWSTLTTTAADATSYVDSSAVVANSYRYRVRGVNFSGVGTAAEVT